VRIKSAMSQTDSCY